MVFGVSTLFMGVYMFIVGILLLPIGIFGMALGLLETIATGTICRCCQACHVNQRGRMACEATMLSIAAGIRCLMALVALAGWSRQCFGVRVGEGSGVRRRLQSGGQFPLACDPSCAQSCSR